MSHRDRTCLTEACELFSQTKLVTSVACLQLVDRGLATLDDPALIRKYLPELDGIPILKGYDDDGKPTLVPSTNPVTLRNLLSHTFESILPIISPLMTRYFEDAGCHNLFAPGTQVSDMVTPLVFNPGEGWSYGYCIDWAGVLVERISGLRLDEYFERNIWAPLGIKHMECFPTDEVKAKKMWVCVRNEAGEPQVMPNGFGLGRAERPEDVGVVLGGGALYGSQKEYLAFLRGILRSDPRYQGSGHALLSTKSYAELFTPSVAPDHPGMPTLVGMVNGWIPFEPATEHTLSHSVGFALSLADKPGRRRAGSGFWGGACKTNYWIDPATGLAGVAGTSLRNGQDPWEEFNIEFERVLYASLA